MEDTNNFIKADDNKFINKKHIRWIKQVIECLEICTRSNGCTSGYTTHRICKQYNNDSYNALNKLLNQHKDIS